MSHAEIKRINGTPAITVNGEVFAGMAMTTRAFDAEYLTGLRKGGIRIFFVAANTDWMRPAGYVTESGVYEGSGFEVFSRKMDKLLAAVPDAYVMVRIGMHPPKEWVENHPDDILRYNDGSTQPCVISSEIHFDHMPGAYSLCSANWRQDGAVALEDFCRKIDNSPYADHVIGYFLAAGGTSEWYYVNALQIKSKKIYGDFSPAFKAAYSAYLREHYPSVEALQKAWGRTDVDFDHPLIPDLNEREYVRIDDAITSDMTNFELKTRSDFKDSYREADTRIGVFLNFNKYRHVYDFYKAWSEGTADTILCFADLLKKRYNDKLVGAFFGALGCTNYYDMSSCAATLRVLDSGNIDFLAAPGVYDNRELGGNIGQREMNDSFLLRNAMFVAEEDTRTHRDCDLFRDTHLLYTSADSVKAMKRDFARNLADGTFAWWFDQLGEEGRYRHPDLYALMKVQQHYAQKAVEYGKPKRNEIALIFDEESVLSVSIGVDKRVLDHYRTAELSRIGASADFYFHNDMSNPAMPDYKLYIMINTYCLSEEERDAIHRKAAKNHATVVWMYAPGLIDLSKDAPLNNENIALTTGMKVKRLDETHSVKFDITAPDHPAMKYAVPDVKYGYIHRPVNSVIWVGNQLSVPFLNPCFVIEDDSATELGRFCIDGTVAMAYKEYKGFVSVYTTAQVLNAELLRGLAEWAGCHIYGYDDDCLYSNENFVTVHAKYTGKHTLYFKEPCDPFEIYEDRFYGKGITKLELDMRLGDTLTFCINNAITQAAQ